MRKNTSRGWQGQIDGSKIHENNTAAFVFESKQSLSSLIIYYYTGYLEYLPSDWSFMTLVCYSLITTNDRGSSGFYKPSWPLVNIFMHIYVYLSLLLFGAILQLNNIIIIKGRIVRLHLAVFLHASHLITDLVKYYSSDQCLDLKVYFCGK